MDGGLPTLSKYKYGIQRLKLSDLKIPTWAYVPAVISYIFLFIGLYFRHSHKWPRFKSCGKNNMLYCDFFIKYFLLLATILLLLTYLTVRYTNCSHLSNTVTIAETFSILAIRKCIFNTPPPWSVWRPFEHEYEVSPRGISNYFTTLETPDHLERMKLMQFNINNSLHLYAANGGITLKQVENAQNMRGWWGSGRVRIQIIKGLVYVIFPPWLRQLNTRQTYTVMQLLDVLRLYKNRIPDVDFVINTSGTLLINGLNIYFNPD